jgi:hypothetical protein
MQDHDRVDLWIGQQRLHRRAIVLRWSIRLHVDWV